MTRYLKLLLKFFKISFMVETEYRVPFLIWVIVNIIWLWITFQFVELTFGQVTNIAGWNKDEVFLLSVVFSLAMNMVWLSILPNLTTFNELINHGKLDLVLTKPVNTRFWISTINFEFDMVPRTFILVPIFWYALGQLSLTPSFFTWVYFVVSFIAGLVICYCFYFSIAILNFWFTNIFNLADFFAFVNDIGRYPTDIFKGGTKIIMGYLLPTAFMGTASTMFLLGRLDLFALVLIVFAAISLLCITEVFWKYALKQYSSASS